MRKKLIIFTALVSLLLLGFIAGQDNQKPDIWQPFKYFVGTWEGQGEGQGGVSKGKQEWAFILSGKYLQVRNEARLTYKILNENEFQQTFDLAAPGKELDCYSTGVMKRVTSHSLQAQPHPVRPQLIPEVLFVQSGKPFCVALRLQMEDGWHTYWKNPGDSGLPTKILWKLPPGFAAGEVQWPYPDTFMLGLDVNYGYEGEAWLLTEITPPATLKAGASISIAASVKWLACLEECLPGGADMMVRLPVKDENPEVDALWSGQFKKTREKIPENSSAWKVSASAEDNLIHLFLAPPPEIKIELKNVHFSPEQSELIDYVEPQTLKKTEAGFVLEVQRSKFSRNWPAKIQGILFSSEGWGEPHGKPAIRVNLKLDRTAP